MCSRVPVFWQRAALPAVLVALCSCFPAIVPVAEIKAGDKVLAARRAPVMEGKETRLIVDAGTELTAVATSGKWVADRIFIEGLPLSVNGQARQAPSKPPDDGTKPPSIKQPVHN